MGKRTSVYLPDELAEAVEASGTGLAELVRLGLEARVPTAVYRLYGAADRLLYVGVSNAPDRRLAEHAKVQPWWPEVERHTVTWYDDRMSAVRAESQAILAEEPAYNTLLPISPDGKWVVVPIRMRASLVAKIDAVRGDQSRSEWVRGVLQAAAANDPRLSAKPPLENPSAGVITDLSDAEVDGFVAAVSEGREPAPAKPRRRAAAPRTVTPAPAGVPAAAFQEPAEPERGAAQCPPHPKGRVTKKFCGACGRPVGDEAVR